MSDMSMTAWETAQAGCIGSVLLDPQQTGLLLSETSERDFSGAGLVLYKAVCSVFGRGQTPDPILVGELLPHPDYRDYMRQVIELTPSAARLPEYIQAVRRRSRISQAHARLVEAQICEDLEALQNILTETMELISVDRGSRSESMADAMTRVLDQLRNGRTYIPSGLGLLDSRVYMSPGDYVVLAGRPSTGKSALAVQMAMAQARSYRVGFYSLEGAAKAPERALIQYSRIPGDKIRLAQLSDSEWQALGEATMAMVQHYSALEFTNAAGWTVDQIIAHALQMQQKVVYIDYLQLCQAPGSSRYEVVTNISQRIHTLAQQHGILVIALSQFSREAAKSGTPEISDLRESGQIEQDADAILMLYLQDKSHATGPRVLKVAKNKEGVTGAIELAFNGSTLRFSALSHREPPVQPRTRQPEPLPDNTPVPEQWLQQTMEGVS